MEKQNQTEKINIKGLSLGQHKFMQLDDSTDWVAEILEEAQAESEPDPNVKSYIKLDLEYVRQHNPSLGDYLILEGKIQSTYQVPCIRCLENGVQHMETTFSLCVLDENFQEDEAFEDLDSYIIGEHEYQLYFTERKQFQLKDAMHEQYFMNTAYLPLHDENCQGLCPECGANRNLEACPHQTTH